MDSRGYLPALDGLRALAIIGVLLFHTSGLTIGWVGVILFFVLSGYLITGILLDAGSEAHYFRNFYARRALRIFPAYFLLLLLTFLALHLVAPSHPALGPEATEWLYFLVYVQNHWMGGNSFRTPLSPPLGHTWTLAIEEQFYLIWPLAAYFLNRKALAAVCIALLAISPVVRIWILQASGNPYLALATLPGQCDALALGALIAVLVRSASVVAWIERRAKILSDGGVLARRWCAWLLFLSLVPLVALIAQTGWQAYVDPDVWLRSSGNSAFITLANLFFAALLLAALNNVAPISTILGNRFFTHIGRISYGLYLYHTLAFYLCDRLLDNLAHRFPVLGSGFLGSVGGTIFKFGVVYLVALLSYRYFESRFLRLKAGFSGRTPTPFLRPP